VPEQTEARESDRVGDRPRVGPHPRERVRSGIVGMITAPVAPMIEGHDGVVLREALHVVGEVFLRAAVPVDEDEPGAGARDLHLELDTVVGPYPHRATSRSIHHRRRARRPRASFAGSPPTVP
jgi:hypothetical protein